MNTDKIDSALESMKSLSEVEKHYVLKRLMLDDALNVLLVVGTYAEYLANFKKDALNDMRKLAEAGITLGEKTIKDLPKNKNPRNEVLNTALANTLLSVGYVGTKYNEELKKNIDMSKVKEDWYESTWALRTNRKG